MPAAEHPRVAIIDFGMGNLFSVKQACLHAGMDAAITADPASIGRADAAVLPGVGAFGDAMATLAELGLDAAVKDFIASGRPFLGICLGMQLLLSQSEEFGDHKGLGVVPGRAVRFPGSNERGERVKVPAVGWNRLGFPQGDARRWDGSCLAGLRDGEFMYFVHSYYCVPDDGHCVLCVSEYCGVEYCSGIRCGNIFAVQFHPEKSGEQGLRIYDNWSKEVKRSMHR